MPTSSPRTASPTGLPTDALRRQIALARIILVIEKILPRLWPAAGFAGFYLALALTGIFTFIPWPVQALILAAAGAAAARALAKRSPVSHTGPSSSKAVTAEPGAGSVTGTMS